MKTKKIGTGFFLLSNSAYVISLASAITLIYFLQQRFVNEVNTKSVNNWITLSATIAALTFALAIASMVCVNILIVKEKRRLVGKGLAPSVVDDGDGVDDSTPVVNDSIVNDCLMTLLFWWCCCGRPEISVFSHNTGSNHDCNGVDGFCIVFAAIVAVFVSMFGYLVYAFETLKKLSGIGIETKERAESSKVPSSRRVVDPAQTQQAGSNCHVFNDYQQGSPPPYAPSTYAPSTYAPPPYAPSPYNDDHQQGTQALPCAPSLDNDDHQQHLPSSSGTLPSNTYGVASSSVSSVVNVEKGMSAPYLQ